MKQQTLLRLHSCVGADGDHTPPLQRTTILPLEGVTRHSTVPAGPRLRAVTRILSRSLEISQRSLIVALAGRAPLAILKIVMSDRIECALRSEERRVGKEGVST